MFVTRAAMLVGEFTYCWTKGLWMPPTAQRWQQIGPQNGTGLQPQPPAVKDPMHHAGDHHDSSTPNMKDLNDGNGIPVKELDDGALDGYQDPCQGDSGEHAKGISNLHEFLVGCQVGFVQMAANGRH